MLPTGNALAESRMYAMGARRHSRYVESLASDTFAHSTSSERKRNDLTHLARWRKSKLIHLKNDN